MDVVATKSELNRLRVKKIALERRIVSLEKKVSETTDGEHIIGESISIINSFEIEMSFDNAQHLGESQKNRTKRTPSLDDYDKGLFAERRKFNQHYIIDI